MLMPAMLGGCDMVVMNPTGDIAVQQRDLILFSTGIMLLVVVPVLAMTMLFAWRYRRGNADKTYDPSFNHSTTLELAIWSIPLLIIVALSAVTWTSTHLLDPFRPLERLSAGRPVPPHTKTLQVQVVALDWKWLFIYPDLGIATVNELALPVDVPVRFSITSTSQFNTFYAPTMAGMIYAMPGMQSELNAVLNKAGESWGYSGNYTGRGYTNMRFKLHALAPVDFDHWVAEVKASKQAGLAPDSYVALARPSEKAPVLHFPSVTPGLFDRALNGCVAPGTPCMVDVMRRDMARGGGMPGGHDTPPATADAPTPALLKAPADKGTSPNVTAPARQHDHTLSAVQPISAAGAPRAARA
uniref:ubiquinol oxidase subunit II n=1 Tax=uncultured Sphingomonas sp. TaxID=158754 RepID=UPI0035CB3929